ncbi:ferritin-like domain-containing protein [Streptomyces sp. GQFP]|nr:ferritin-like domain-containing protein [Streptomyces sp. GQFP]UIX31478.1 ferritin-like domain-containing protein [Streptomyces sp. GQFP]
MLVLEQRGLDVTDEIRDRITSCDDTATLRARLTRALTATSAAEIFTDR